MPAPTREQMRTALVAAFDIVERSADIYELAMYHPAVEANRTFALAVLETMERDGLAERVGRSPVHSRNYMWRLIK